MDESSVVAALSALAQATRLRVFRRLVRAGSAGLSAGELARGEGAPHNTMSAHLSVLARARLLTSRRDGRAVYYAADADGARALVRVLARDVFAAAPDVPVVRPLNVLFLCAANSARSIMAEAILRNLGADGFSAFSAGPSPAARPQPLVLAALREKGIATGGLRSKSWDEFVGPGAPHMDIVVALCEVFEGRKSPSFGPRAAHVAWILPDPARFVGSPAERRALVAGLIEGLNRRVAALTRLPAATMSRKRLTQELQIIGEGGAT